MRSWRQVGQVDESKYGEKHYSYRQREMPSDSSERKGMTATIQYWKCSVDSPTSTQHYAVSVKLVTHLYVFETYLSSRMGLECNPLLRILNIREFVGMQHKGESTPSLHNFIVNWLRFSRRWLWRMPSSGIYKNPIRTSQETHYFSATAPC
jgi:hypothetical protein